MVSLTIQCCSIKKLDVFIVLLEVKRKKTFVLVLKISVSHGFGKLM